MPVRLPERRLVKAEHSAVGTTPGEVRSKVSENLVSMDASAVIISWLWAGGGEGQVQKGVGTFTFTMVCREALIFFPPVFSNQAVKVTGCGSLGAKPTCWPSWSGRNVPFGLDPH